LGTETGICGDLGIAGNARADDIWSALFLAGHGQIPMKTLSKVMKACHVIPTNLHFAQTHACDEALAQMRKQAGGYFEYSLYDDCTYRNGMMRGALNDYPCGGGVVMEQYLHRKDVKRALHVQNAEFFSVDNAEGDFDYTPTEKDLTGFYKEINGKLRVLIYNGDADPAINSFAAENWTSSLGFEETQEWRPWTSDGCRQMGGYVTRYAGDFDYLTIRGAGHMVC
jgi:hypothetical protein